MKEDQGNNYKKLFKNCVPTINSPSANHVYQSNRKRTKRPVSDNNATDCFRKIKIVTTN
jgi:hypothetical protein